MVGGPRDAAGARRARGSSSAPRSLGERLLELTRPLVDEFDVVREVRGLGLMWAIEFAEPESGSSPGKMIERMQPGLFAQLVVVPLFAEHRILSQVAGHNIAVLKVLPPLVVTDEDIEYFVDALRDDDQARAAHAERAHAVRVDRRRYPLELVPSSPRSERERMQARGPRVRRCATIRPRPSTSSPRLRLDLDHDLMQRRLDVVAELVALLRDDRERRRRSSRSRRARSSISAGVALRPANTPKLTRTSRRGLVRESAHAEMRSPGSVSVSRGSHRNLNTATTSPATPQAASTPMAGGFVQNRVAVQIDRVDEVDEVLERQHVADRAQERRIVARRPEGAREERHRQQDEVHDRGRALAGADERRRRDAERGERAAPSTIARSERADRARERRPVQRARPSRNSATACSANTISVETSGASDVRRRQAAASRAAASGSPARAAARA